jgi:hypothetical protein
LSYAQVAAEDEEEQPRFSLPAALPLSVWRDHVVPLLEVTEATALRVVCKALRVVVNECPLKLVGVKVTDLRAALACFPAAESLTMSLDHRLDAAKESRMVELLTKHGKNLKRFDASDLRFCPYSGMEGLLLSALRAGALPNLIHAKLHLQEPATRQLLLPDGLLGHVEELSLDVGWKADAEQLAALQHLGRLSHLRALSLKSEQVQVDAPLLPSIPPSPKALTLRIKPAAALDSLLCDLPSLLQASGASLEEFRLHEWESPSAEACAAVAQVLRHHWQPSTLKRCHHQPWRIPRCPRCRRRIRAGAGPADLL